LLAQALGMGAFGSKVGFFKKTGLNGIQDVINEIPLAARIDPAAKAGPEPEHPQVECQQFARVRTQKLDDNFLPGISGAVHLPNAGCSQGCFFKNLEGKVERHSKLAFKSRLNDLKRRWHDVVLKAGKLCNIGWREKVGANAEKLPQLDKNDPQPLAGVAQTLGSTFIKSSQIRWRKAQGCPEQATCD
jgi:hypothetical protein